ncbi:peptidoglycan-binding protein [Clostridium sp. SHJSY1]|uniref:GH25 family lysozyme n=1 Tax=Clostridium sp. SHJSY1 TaxID=2942483 RepID=UPI0028747384|nr:GH25 family lysozyme [Clostridium sp. SHJSY1]MDS0524550.1 peptidoglycan-binding protein [Clostridium sp. SHJSY1]
MKGIDISNHNGNIDFNKVKDSGVELVYIKATEGTTYKDPYRDVHYNGATSVGLPVGFYHYLVGSSSPETQAENFYNAIKDKNNILKPALDIEATGFNVMEYALTFISKFNTLSDLPIVIYSSPYYINNNLDSRLTSYPLWVAHYGVDTPMRNNVWGSNYVGHQYTEKGNVPGISGNVDLNNFYDGIFISSRGNSSQGQEYTLLEKARNYIGSRTKELQEKLISRGYDCGGYGADGIFGQGTLNSLLQFQRDNGLVADGLAGTQTFSKLNSEEDSIIAKLQTEINSQGFGKISVDGIAGNETINYSPTLKLGTKGEITKVLQILLNRKGYSLAIDGIFGTATQNAVKSFQRSKGLSEDGVVGSNTWRNILK